MLQISRRSILVGSGASLLASGLGGCQTQQPVNPSFGQVAVAPAPSTPIPNGELVEEPIAARPSAVASAAYGPVSGERFPLPAAPLSRINPAFLRTRIAYARNEAPGTIVIDPRARYLYFVEEGGRAMRYGVGVGREGFAWSGTATIHEKQEWPDWYPPKEMIERQPELRSKLSELQSGLGVPGGPRNPLGAALCTCGKQQRHALPDPRHQRTVDGRHERLVWLHQDDQSGRYRPVRPHCRGSKGGGA